MVRKKINPLKAYLKQERGNTRPKLVKKLDTLFSVYMKEKAQGICAKCGLKKDNAGVSHYFGRKHIGTRWDEDNCIWACWGCHYYHLEHEKTPGSWYYTHMVQKLGEDGMERLKVRAYGITKFNTSDLQILIMQYDN